MCCVRLMGCTWSIEAAGTFHQSERDALTSRNYFLFQQVPDSGREREQ